MDFLQLGFLSLSLLLFLQFLLMPSSEGYPSWADRTWGSRFRCCPPPKIISALSTLLRVEAVNKNMLQASHGCLKLQRTVIAVRKIREACGCWWSVPKDLPQNVGFSRLITATFSCTLWISTLRATSAAKRDPLPPSARRPRSFSKQRPRIDEEQGRTYQGNWSQSMRLSWRTNPHPKLTFYWPFDQDSNTSGRKPPKQQMLT